MQKRKGLSSTIRMIFDTIIFIIRLPVPCSGSVPGPISWAGSGSALVLK